jgi:hypothetical protein
MAEALVVREDRSAAAEAATAGRDDARRVGSEWLVEAFESLAARARVRLGGETAPVPAAMAGEPEEHPFGLCASSRFSPWSPAARPTARSAASFTWPKAGQRPCLADPAKLDVRSRTEAAALVHRQGLAGEAQASPNPGARGEQIPV